jgi:hypothetical protein
MTTTRRARDLAVAMTALPFAAPAEGKTHRIAQMALENPDVDFAACGNTLKAISAKAGHDVALLDEANVVTSGVVRLVGLQEEGYANVGP